MQRELSYLAEQGDEVQREQADARSKVTDLATKLKNSQFDVSILRDQGLQWEE